MSNGAEDEVISELVARGKESSLSGDDLFDALGEMQLTADQVDGYYGRLTQQGIRLTGPDFDNFRQLLEELLSDPTNDPLRAYLRTVATIEPAVGNEASGDGENSRRRIMEGSQWLVITISQRYLGRGMRLYDLIPRANAGLLFAVNRFDPHKGVPFDAYATWWIRREVERAIAENDQPVRIPMTTISGVLRAEERLKEGLGREPTSREVAHSFGLDLELFASILRSPNLKPEPVPPSLNYTFLCAIWEAEHMQKPTPAEQKARIRWVYNTAADHFDDPPLNFWNHCGARSVEVAGIQEGHLVFDVCCGTGASAIPAAERVGRSGRVTGLDFAENLLEAAQAKARDRGLRNLDLVHGDMTALPFPDQSFDVVNCVFGIFFAPDMAFALSGLWNKVRPGGTIALTVWGERALEPGGTVFWEALDAIRPDLRPKVIPWERLSRPDGLATLFAEAGLPEPEIVSESLGSPASPEDLWTIVLGSGFRGTIEQMKPEEAARLRSSVVKRLEAEEVGEVSSDFLHARAGKT